MVQFAKLRLTGFKSFVEPTELAIESGVTGIVGPNGCGKSNLVEALRWVMGETSAKRMRGGEMDDVIFSGSAARPGRNIAEVVVTLDNASRRAPAQFNDAEELEITRRIERGSGSIYRINGREVRARDVQLLFADAATGAHSTALVSQGRIGAIINAKPTDRRGLLEEAAGISGLHSRRHEAELRLRAAESNLARLDDVIVTLESQLQALKKQARQANRYRTLNDHVRRAEALLIHLQWQEALGRIEAARAALDEAERAVAERTGAVAAATTAEANASAALPPLRQTEVEMAAELQRLNLARAGLDTEEARIREAAAETAQRLVQIRADLERERRQEGEAGEAMRRIASECERLEAAAASESEALALSADQVNVAGRLVDQLELELAELAQTIAADEARQTALDHRISEVTQHLERLAQRRADAEAEHAKAAPAAADTAALAAARAAVTGASQAFERLRAQADAAERSRIEAGAAEVAARDSFQAAQERRAKLIAERDALASMYTSAQNETWPALIDAIEVERGFEIALGAGLGDDLDASADADAPAHWRGLPQIDQPALPPGAEPLSLKVHGADLLLRRLSQIGVVADRQMGDLLQSQLAQGQRLVTAEGHLWRWDGYVASAGAPTAAATRLHRRNRLAELAAAVTPAEAELAAAEQSLVSARSRATEAGERERAQRQGEREAADALAVARATESQAANAVAAANSRLSALTETLEALAADIAEIEDSLAVARQDRAAMPDLSERRERAERKRSELIDKRTELVELRAAQDRLIRESELRREWLKAAEEEAQNWARRREGSRRQIEELTQRETVTVAEHRRLERRPQEIEEQRLALLGHISAAEQNRKAAADRLAEAESAQVAAARTLRELEAALHEMREERVRLQGSLAQADAVLEALDGRSRERLDCRPAEALALSQHDPSTDLPERSAIEAKLERLIRERENIGPVNLRAEAEAAELSQQITGLQTERADLVAAIARLRQGIASLNREGRERLLAAFEQVNTHFEELFVRLFGGGRAHLALTESEDPLEAGLEIMASPPGKRLQVMSLLSGGEQALTALALLFAVFLTNPAPICVLDEVDAPLDDANVERFCALVEDIARSSQTRFLIITHHRLTMARMDRLFGVTMAEQGVSQLVSVDLQRAETLAETA
ncbi:MAG TPA: AAA family ATPase [Alphaproteobacteria bacterium]|nr:AAA family ATPase [Alphaproteobacteria bacterium]